MPRAASQAVRKSDLVLGLLALAAIAATAVGALSGDRWTEERTLRFATSEQTLPPSELVPAGGGGARFNWTMPDNATAANLTISLYFEGQALRGGNAIVSVRVTMPDGRDAPPVVASWTIPQGATSAQTSVNASAVWDQMPAELRDTTEAGHGTTWSRPLEVLALVERPSDLPLAQYAFTAQVSGTLQVYARA